MVMVDRKVDPIVEVVEGICHGESDQRPLVYLLFKSKIYGHSKNSYNSALHLTSARPFSQSRGF